MSQIPFGCLMNRGVLNVYPFNKVGKWWWYTSSRPFYLYQKDIIEWAIRKNPILHFRKREATWHQRKLFHGIV